MLTINTEEDLTPLFALQIDLNQRTGSIGKVQEELHRLHWENNVQPQWFITLLWNDLPTRSETTISHSRHFRNVFLTSLLNQPLKKLPEPPFRPHLVFFHERKLLIHEGRQVLAFHTHLHMGALPDPLNHLWYLDHLIHQKVSPRVQKLLKTTSEGNRGVVIKPCLLYTSPSPRDATLSRMPSSA